MNIPLIPQEASLLYIGANGQQRQQASPSDSYGLGFPKAIESEIDLVNVLHHLSKLLSLYQSDVSWFGPDMIERKERERRDIERVSEPFASLPLIFIVLFSQMHHLALNKRTKTWLNESYCT